MRSVNSIFVYGSLQPGKQHEDLLKNLKGSWKKAFVFGNMINLENGVNYGYPALKIFEGGSKIFGMVFYSDELKNKLKELDEFEGSDYKRIITNVNLEDGTKVQAYLYEHINSMLSK